MNDNSTIISLGQLYTATVKLRPATRIEQPELIPYDGQRSVFFTTWLFEREGARTRGEMALIHPEWDIKWIASGDVTDVEVCEKDPFDVWSLFVCDSATEV